MTHDFIEFPSRTFYMPARLGTFMYAHAAVFKPEGVLGTHPIQFGDDNPNPLTTVGPWQVFDPNMDLSLLFTTTTTTTTTPFYGPFWLYGTDTTGNYTTTNFNSQTGLYDPMMGYWFPIYTSGHAAEGAYGLNFDPNSGLLYDPYHTHSFEEWGDQVFYMPNQLAESWHGATNPEVGEVSGHSGNGLLRSKNTDLHRGFRNKRDHMYDYNVSWINGMRCFRHSSYMFVITCRRSDEKCGEFLSDKSWGVYLDRTP